MILLMYGILSVLLNFTEILLYFIKCAKRQSPVSSIVQFQASTSYDEPSFDAEADRGPLWRSPTKRPKDIKQEPAEEEAITAEGERPLFGTAETANDDVKKEVKEEPADDGYEAVKEEPLVDVRLLNHFSQPISNKMCQKSDRKGIILDSSP